jgi:hypothetical protein
MSNDSEGSGCGCCGCLTILAVIAVCITAYEIAKLYFESK